MSLTVLGLVAVLCQFPLSEQGTTASRNQPRTKNSAGGVSQEHPQTVSQNAVLAFLNDVGWYLEEHMDQSGQLTTSPIKVVRYMYEVGESVMANWTALEGLCREWDKKDDLDKQEKMVCYLLIPAVQHVEMDYVHRFLLNVGEAMSKPGKSPSLEFIFSYAEDYDYDPLFRDWYTIVFACQRTVYKSSTNQRPREPNDWVGRGLLAPKSKKETNFMKKTCSTLRVPAA